MIAIKIICLSTKKIVWTLNRIFEKCYYINHFLTNWRIVENTWRGAEQTLQDRKVFSDRIESLILIILSWESKWSNTILGSSGSQREIPHKSLLSVNLSINSIRFDNFNHWNNTKSNNIFVSINESIPRILLV